MDANSFPLSASVFERYMLLDDRPSHPMQSFVEVELEGKFSVEDLQQALPAALARHPLMSSVIRRDRRNRSEWHFHPIPPVVESLPADAPLPIQTTLDLEQRPGLRVWTRPREKGLLLILLAHHAACDALGMLTFLTEWLALASGQEKRLPESSAAALPAREDLQGIPAAFSRRQRWRNIVRYLFGQPPIAMALPAENKTLPPESIPPEESTYHTVSLTEEETDLLKQAARSCRSSVNDTLAAALFVTLREWDAKHRSEPTTRPWRVLVPVNRRPSDRPYHSACNMIGYKMLTRDAGELRETPAVLKSISEEMEPVRKHPRGVHSFLKMLKRMDRLGLLNRIIQRYDCFATVILSNVGDLDRYFAPLLNRPSESSANGGVQIRSIRCAPPRRPNTHLTIVALTSGGELQLVASRISPGLDSATTLAFLQSFRQFILATARELLAATAVNSPSDRLEG